LICRVQSCTRWTGFPLNCSFEMAWHLHSSVPLNFIARFQHFTPYRSANLPPNCMHAVADPLKCHQDVPELKELSTALPDRATFIIITIIIGPTALYGPGLPFLRTSQHIIVLGSAVYPTSNSSNPGGSMFFCQGFLQYLTGPHFKASGIRSPPLHDIAVYTLLGDHDMDTHA
jgi:hypothetical protein